MIAFLNAITCFLPVFSCAVPLVSSTSSDLAHLGHGGQAAGEFADDLFLVATQLVDVEHRLTEVHAQVGHVADLVHHGGHVQERLGRDAAHVQAHTTQGGVALDQHDLETQIGGAEGSAVATGATAEHEHVAVEIGRTGEGGSSGSGDCGFAPSPAGGRGLG